LVKGEPIFALTAKGLTINQKRHRIPSMPVLYFSSSG